MTPNKTCMPAAKVDGAARMEGILYWHTPVTSPPVWPLTGHLGVTVPPMTLSEFFQDMHCVGPPGPVTPSRKNIRQACSSSSVVPEHDAVPGDDRSGPCAMRCPPQNGASAQHAPPRFRSAPVLPIPTHHHPPGGGFPAAAGQRPGISCSVSKIGLPGATSRSVSASHPRRIRMVSPLYHDSLWLSRFPVILPQLFSEISNICSITSSTGSRPVTSAPMRSGSRSGPWIQNRHPPR